MIGQIKFFKDNKDSFIKKDLLEICMNMKYKFKEAGETVFYQGDIGEEFFIIIKGKVQVSVTEKDQSYCPNDSSNCQKEHGVILDIKKRDHKEHELETMKKDHKKKEIDIKVK